MYIDDIIAEFDEILDTYDGPIDIRGHKFEASEALKTLKMSAYLKELDRHIVDNYETNVDDEDGAIIYTRNNSR